MSNRIARRKVRARRTEKQVAAWRELTAWQRRLLLSPRPDDFERENALVAGTWRDLEAHLGPRVWTASLADPAEPLDEEPLEHDTLYSDGMTLDEIAADLRLSRERVRQIERTALRKLRAQFERRAFRDLVDGPTARQRSAIETAIESARRANA